MRKNDLLLFFAIVLLLIASFAVTSGYIGHRAAAIDQCAIDISENAAPSILHLSTADREVKDLQLKVERLLNRANQGLFLPTVEVTEQGDRILAEVALYERLPEFPGEDVVAQRVHKELANLRIVAAQFVALYQAHRREDSTRLAHGELHQAATRTIDAIMDVIEVNARNSQDRARRIRTLRLGLAHSALILHILTISWTIVCVGLLAFAIRKSAIRQAEQQIATARATELELFGGRVAHDILNPVQVLTLLVASLEREPTKEQLQTLAARARANLKRIQQLLDGLLSFARAGARPEPGVRAEVSQVLAELEPELRAQAAAAGIEFRVEPCAPCSVVCSPGILNSLLTNLIHNAIKYMGSGAERRIAIRVLERGIMVRFEVEDTGLGLSPDLAKVVFDPHIRGPGSSQPGFGLGLATVRKAAEAHGGKVGVRSAEGSGSLFWFELPRAW